MLTMTSKDASGPGRVGWMSRHRKHEALLYTQRGEELNLVLRSLGFTATTPSVWCDAVLAAGEACLAIYPALEEIPTRYLSNGSASADIASSSGASISWLTAWAV